MAAREDEEVVRQSIEERKRDLHRALDDLRRAASHWIDARAMIRRQPSAWLLAGALFGVWLGTKGEI